MSNNWFRFKRFRIEQSLSAMKVGTDGVLLGAWARVDKSSERLLDIGTGTGLIALMLAQRSEQSRAAIDGVEIDPASYREATQNVEASEWSDRISLFNESLQKFASEPSRWESYDHLVSNPPFFVDSLQPPDPARAAARHARSLAYEELIGYGARLLRPDGLLSVIIPYENTGRFIDIAAGEGFACDREISVSSVPGSPPIRSLLEMRLGGGGVPQKQSLVIGDGTPGGYSDGYRALTADFYLKF